LTLTQSFDASMFTRSTLPTLGGVAGAQMFSFLLIGDQVEKSTDWFYDLSCVSQNAGKSTFLHSFTYEHDRNWLEINSILPIISSSFCNTRF
jgi:hypothetical protein